MYRHVSRMCSLDRNDCAVLTREFATRFLFALTNHLNENRNLYRIIPKNYRCLYYIITNVTRDRLLSRTISIIRADSSVSLTHWRFAVQFPDPILDRIPPTVNDISFSRSYRVIEETSLRNTGVNEGKIKENTADKMRMVMEKNRYSPQIWILFFNIRNLLSLS